MSKKAKNFVHLERTVRAGEENLREKGMDATSWQAMAKGS